MQLMLANRKLNRYRAYGAAILLGGGYLAWSLWGSRPPEPGQVVTAPTASAVADMPTKLVSVPKFVVFSDPAKVAQKMGTSRPAAKEEIPQAVEVPKLRYGGKAVVYTNTSTGQSRTEIKANESPWFALERGNRAGVELGIGNRGRYYQADYQRDLVSIKGVVVAGRGEVTSYADSTDWRAGVRAEWRW